MRRPSIGLLLAAVALTVAGCGGEMAADATNEEHAPKESKRGGGEAVRVAASGAKGTRVKVVSSEYGRVIADGKGEALYLFDREKAPRSACYGACARAWPPVLTAGRPRAAAGAHRNLLGTTRRRDGRLQVTYAGHPLYYYVSDSPGTILCHDVAEFGGLWLVVEPSGRAVS